ncbi:MAG: hypothetical protein KH382_09320 [Clostridiales bacterium]|nr:hypothetical protein [Clostridiales bacterium]
MQPDKKLKMASRLSDLKKIALSLFWWILWGCSYVRFIMQRHIAVKDISSMQWLFIAILAVVPFLFFGLWRVLWDRSWDGVVVKKRVGRIYATKEGKYLGHHGEDAEYVYVKKPNGKLFVMTFYDKNILGAGHYNIGDRVHHYKNLPFCEKHDKSDSPERLCVFCGNLTKDKQEHCAFCWKHLPEVSPESI